MIIDGFDTWNQGHFTMTAFSAPNPKYRENFQEVPGVDGILDRSDLPLGRPIYNSRPVTATFECSYGSMTERQAVFDQLIAQVNGRRVHISDPDHPQSYFIGRVHLYQSFNKPTWGELKLEAVCDPWRYSSTPNVEVCRMLTDADNKLINGTVTLLEDLSTAENPTVATDSRGTFGLHAGEVGRMAIWSIVLEPNTSYFASAFMRDGRGTWGCATSPDSLEWNRGMVSTGSDGMLYIRLQAYSSEWLVLTPFIIVPAKEVPVLSNGSMPVVAKTDLGSQYSVVYGTAGTLTHVYSSELTLPPGSCPMVIYAFTHNAPKQVLISWTRGDM